MPVPQVIAREYLRVSKKAVLGHEASPAEQHDAHQRESVARGWLLGEPYRDIGSASRYARKARNDFDRLIADLGADTFGAQILMLWESSRGSRKVGEWVELIELCNQRKVRIFVKTHGRILDPSNNRDRRTLLEDAVDSEFESGKTSERLTRSHASRAAAGRAVGRISYGYKRVYDERSGALLGRVPDPDKAKHVRELFARFVAGDTLRKIELDWATRGITNDVGKRLTSPQLRDMLRNRVYIAERVHIPGRVSRWWKHPDEAIITAAEWEPLIERPAFFAVQTVLSDPARVKTRPGSARHLLSMFTRCDSCGGPMCVITQRGREVYRCRAKGCAQVDKEDLDRFAEGLLLDFLASPAAFEDLTHAGEATRKDLAAARSELEELQQHHHDLVKSFRARRISLVAFEATEPDLLRDLDALAARVRQLESPPVLRGLIEPGVDVAKRWAKILDPTIRRRIAQIVLTPGLAGQLRVMPSPSPGHRVPIERRVDVVRD